jgi:hypothetical protein
MVVCYLLKGREREQLTALLCPQHVSQSPKVARIWIGMKVDFTIERRAVSNRVTLGPFSNSAHLSDVFPGGALAVISQPIELIDFSILASTPLVLDLSIIDT